MQRIRRLVTIDHNGIVTPDVTIYLPFPEAEFAAQRHLGDQSVWVVVHVATMLLVPWPCPRFDTLGEALTVANRFSVECPSAAAVRTAIDGKLTGDRTKLRDEVIASLEAA